MGYLAATEADHLPLMVQERADQLSADYAAGACDGATLCCWILFMVFLRKG